MPLSDWPLNPRSTLIGVSNSWGPFPLFKTACKNRTLLFTIALLGISFVGNAGAFDGHKVGSWRLTPSVETRFGLQYGDNINFGLGALDDLNDKTRASLSLSFEPKIFLERPVFGGTFFSNVSFVGATNVLDGELSGQFARSGDSRVDIDEAHVGWRNETFSFAIGPQVLVIGDGLVLGDGVFDLGSEQGQFWIAPFDAWKNAAVLKVSTEQVHSDLFWLTSGGGFGDTRLFGGNLENVDTRFGRFGAMYIDIYDGDSLNFDGIKAWNLRALDVPVPYLPQIKLFAEVVVQLGEDKDGGEQDNDGLGWYIEAAYTLDEIPWTTILTYRYSRFSGDQLDTLDNEGYRYLFYGFYAREWDTFYQGEIAGEYHLFNSNQITQFVKVRTFPINAYALTFYYFHHDLEEPNYFGIPVSSSDWAEEINAGVEYFGGKNDNIYIYAGVAWSSPNSAAKEIFGNDDFTVVQTWMSFKF